MEHKTLILFFYLFTLLAGTLFFIPAVFVNRFTTAPAVWMQAGVGIGLLGYVLLNKPRISVPPKEFLILLAIAGLYLLSRILWSLESRVTVLTLIAAFFLFYAIGIQKRLFMLFSLLGAMLALWGLGQYAGLLPSYHGVFPVTGPFDNPAGLSASLALLLPFSLYGCTRSSKKYRLLFIVAACLTGCVIILSQARAAILATIVILCFFFIRFLSKKKRSLSLVHYFVISLAGIGLIAGLAFLKKDSAGGRLLIWKCTGQLIARKPVFGFGHHGFTANYMNEQAAYFTHHPDSQYAMLADNIRHPFNEYLKWLTDYGIAGFCLIILLIAIPLYHSRKNHSPEAATLRLSLLSIGICALFSYPLNYPFIRLMTVMILAFLLAAGQTQQTAVPNNGWLKGAVSLFSLALLSVTVYQAFCEREWHTIAHRSLRGQTGEMLPRYKSLYPHLRKNELFLYNYAAELNVSGHYTESLQVAHECEKRWADYDLQMLMADDCLQSQPYGKTETHLKQAAAMCPVKFMPLYRLAEFYKTTGRNGEARKIAQIITDKKIKIPSPIINSIKNKMQNLLNEPDSVNDSPQRITSDKTTTSYFSWQEHLLKDRPPRALLPT
ncbi:MAG TPA: hypothetical protein DDZ96_06055 [Porphyromonadaceae bacterium]|jgi:O-antigen ligase|nr:hypothetical protein [Porphyromonadaceae bacterium]HBL33371.1 hypothetical protein [Porphyromonadaceae bacterium]